MLFWICLLNAAWCSVTNAFVLWFALWVWIYKSDIFEPRIKERRCNWLSQLWTVKARIQQEFFSGFIFTTAPVVLLTAMITDILIMCFIFGSVTRKNSGTQSGYLLLSCLSFSYHICVQFSQKLGRHNVRHYTSHGIAKFLGRQNLLFFDHWRRRTVKFMDIIREENE